MSGCPEGPFISCTSPVSGPCSLVSWPAPSLASCARQAQAFQVLTRYTHTLLRAFRTPDALAGMTAATACFMNASSPLKASITLKNSLVGVGVNVSSHTGVCSRQNCPSFHVSASFLILSSRSLGCGGRGKCSSFRSLISHPCPLWDDAWSGGPA